jgi:predicted secreted protein
MAGTIGRLARVKVSDDDVTYNKVGKVMSADFSITTNLADCTNNDSNGYVEEQVADQQMTVDVTAKYVASDTAQGQLIAAKMAKSTIYVQAFPQESTGENKWAFLANITDLSISTATGDVEELSVTLQSTGTITKTVQT